MCPVLPEREDVAGSDLGHRLPDELVDDRSWRLDRGGHGGGVPRVQLEDQQIVECRARVVQPRRRECQPRGEVDIGPAAEGPPGFTVVWLAGGPRAVAALQADFLS